MAKPAPATMNVAARAIHRPPCAWTCAVGLTLTFKVLPMAWAAMPEPLDKVDPVHWAALRGSGPWREAVVLRVRAAVGV
jgi:hypothetical protein